MRAGRRSLVGAVGALALAAGFLGAAPPAFAAGAVSLSAFDVAYTQNFDTLGNTAASNVLPNGWALAESGTSTTNDGNYNVSTGSATAGDTYSFGSSGSTDRAFGGQLSGTLTPTVGAAFANATGGTLTSADVAYTGEQWRFGAISRADRLDFQVSTDATSLTTGTWTDVDALDFTGNVLAAAGSLDGNAAANRKAVSGTLTGLAIPAGGTVWIRWTDFNASGSDDGLAVDDFSLTPHGTTGPPADEAPSVTATTPANGASGVAGSSSLSVTFSEPVIVTDAYSLTCGGAAQPFTLSGSDTTYTLDPTADLPDGATCTLTVNASGVADSDENDPPNNPTADKVVTFSTGTSCGAAYTHAYEIQGENDVPAITGSVTTQGVVVGDYEGASPALRGFYVQDVTGDGIAATSDAIFVFEGSNANSVALGDVVRVTGNASDQQGQTQITLASGTTPQQCGTATVAPTDVRLPFASVGYPERYEGMLVRMPQTLSVSEHFQIGRSGEVLMSSGGRLPQPTSIAAPGADALEQQALNDRNQVLFDDGSQEQNSDPIGFGRGGAPLSASNTLRGGDTATNSVGVLTYTWGGYAASPNAFRLRPIGAMGGSVQFQPSNPRPAGAAARAAGTDVRVAGMNLLNFFNTFSGCASGTTGGPMDCRGADNQAEFERQWPKTVEGITGTGADVIGINEIENDGYGPSSAIAFLVDKLNAKAGPGTYAFVDVDTATGQADAAGSDAIKVGVLYKPAVVTPVGTTAVLNSVAFVNGGDGAPRARPSVAQAFATVADGSTFVVDVNHLKSKGSACTTADALDGSGNCDEVRNNSAKALAAWLDTDPTGVDDPDVLLVGDYNSYAMERPVKTLEAAGYANLIRQRIGAEAYSYVFDGQWGYLDYAFGTAAIQPQVVGVQEWHINADEPSVLDYNTNFKTANLQTTLYAPDEFRISDHDPVIVDLALTPPAETSTTTLAITPSGQAYGTPTPASWTATVTLNRGGSPDGTVELLDGSTVVSTAAVSGGKATGTVPGTLPAGTYSLTARFVPRDAGAATGSTSAAATFTVRKAVSTTGLTVKFGKVKGTGGPNGYLVQMTATVSLETGRTPQGSVVFRLDGVEVGQAAVTGGTAVASTTTTKGSHDVMATFVPADPANHLGSSASTTVRVK